MGLPEAGRMMMACMFGGMVISAVKLLFWYVQLHETGPRMVVSWVLTWVRSRRGWG